MKFLTGIEWTPKNILKYGAIALVALVFASLVYSFVTTTMGSMPFGHDFGMPGMGNTVSFSAAAPQASYDMQAGGSSGYGGGFQVMSLSTRNAASSMGETATLAPLPGPTMGTTGAGAEDYEVTEYSASIETREPDTTCAKVSSLKAYSYVIFENANDNDHGCDFRFKVEKARVPEVLAFVKQLDPKDLNENTYTIKNVVDDYTSQTDVLSKKLDEIDDTLAQSVAAYDKIAATASENGDTDTLAKIIDSKINLIAQLSQQKIDISSQLDQLARSKADQLDRLAYTYFNVSAYEQKYFDGQALKDSWVQAVQQFFRDLNKVAQDLTVNLILLVFLAIQWLIYFFIVLFIAKYVWKWGRRIWVGHTVVTKPVVKNGRRKVIVSAETDES